MCRVPRAIVVLIFLAFVAQLLAAPTARAAAQPVTLPASVVYEPDPAPGVGRCGLTAFIQFADTPGISAYHAAIDDQALGHRTFSGPPFPSDAAATDPLFIQYAAAPPGQHRFALSGVAAPAGACQSFFAGRFSNLALTGDPVAAVGNVSGHVTDSGGNVLPNVTVRASGATTQTTTTDFGGAYSFQLPAGTYTIAPVGDPPGLSGGTYSASNCSGTSQPSACSIVLADAGQARADFTYTVSALSIDDVKVTKPSRGTATAKFTVTLSPASSGTVAVGYRTQDGSAIGGTDYQAAQGTLTFPPGTTVQTISVTVLNGRSPGSPQTFSVVLSAPSNARIAKTTGTGTIEATLRLDSVRPITGPPTGTTALTLTGIGFGKPGDSVSVSFTTHCSDGKTVKASGTKVQVLSSQRLRVTAPPETCASLLSNAAADVSVQTSSASGGAANSNSQTYTYRPVYVALGDSYASGLGTGNYTPGSGNCRRSPAAYGPLISTARTYSFKFTACAGATTSSVIANQVSALDSTTTLATITVGGNDAKFEDVIVACTLLPSSACNAQIKRAHSFISSQLPALLDTVYSAIGARATHARIAVVGYPRLFINSGQTCANGRITADEERRLNQVADVLDGVIASRAAAHGFIFVDPRADYSTHEVCSSTPWLNGFTPTAPYSSYHPKTVGQADLALLLKSALP